MAATAVIEREIETQRRLISRLKREIFGVDKTHNSLYIKEFNAEFRDFRRVVTAEAVIDRAAKSDIVYFGDYHPLESSQDWALRFMRDLSSRGRPVVLALEMLYVHQQEHLDRWMQGSMTEEEFLEAIDYRSEWGFDWKSFRRFFELAKDPFIPIFGIDSGPRENLRYIRRRDRLAARRIATIRRFFPGHVILVVVGESHLASLHLPDAVRSAAGERFRETIVVQNVDDIHWDLLRAGRGDAEAVEIDRSRFCLLTTSPLLKYQAYRDIIDVWAEGEDGDQYTPFVHDSIRSLIGLLDTGGMKRRVTIRNGWRAPVGDALPEVHFRRTYQAFSSYLRSRRVGPREILRVLERLRTGGAAYVPAENALLVTAFDRSAAIREAARFVVHAMRDDINRGPHSAPSGADAFYRGVIDEALVCLAAEMMNPAGNSHEAAPSGGTAGGSGPQSGCGDRRVSSERRTIERLARYHAGREGAAPKVPRMTRPLRRIFALGPGARPAIERALGARLAGGLHRLVLEGRLSPAEMRALHRRRLDAPGEATRLYFALVGRSRPGRT